MLKKLKQFVETVIAWLIVGAVVVGFFAIFAFLWWLDHVRFVYGD